MISIRNTENLLGVTIRGDYDDFYNLVEAFYEVTIGDDSTKYKNYIDMSIRLLGLCYDVRHAYMGDRDLAFVENNLCDEKMKWHGVIAPRENLYYEFNYLYPEMIYAMIAIDELINIRMEILANKSSTAYNFYNNKKVIYDKTITTLRSFQAAFAECVRETLTPNLYSRWLNSITKPYISLSYMYQQYLDIVNLDYHEMPKDKRLKSFTAMTRRIADYFDNEEYREIKKEIMQTAKEYGCHETDIKLVSYDLPETIEW